MKYRVLFVMQIFLAIGLVINPLPALAAGKTTHKVCSTIVRPGFARCFSSVVNDPSGMKPLATAKPLGYSPTDFTAAYGNHGNGTATIGIVGAYDAPHLLHDINIYSQQFGLPTMTACTTIRQTDCLSKSDQTGANNLPLANSSWAVETSLDSEIAHGLCPGCRLDVVEATSTSMVDLSAAAQEAYELGANVISNSYGGPESSGEARFDHNYLHPGVATVVSSGDNGYGTNYPASIGGVVAVGGTTLTMQHGQIQREVAWNGAGSGCSSYEYKPSWQKDTRCPMRAVADIAADADPATGAAIYDSYPTDGRSGWFSVGGTSLAAPLVAGILANTGQYSDEPARLYRTTGSLSLRDITSGANGVCSITYLCKAGPGYDGPTGLGVPKL